jgi:predicted nucleotide-binding protein
MQPGIREKTNEDERRRYAEKHRQKVFIVHGHDDVSKLELARFLFQKGLEPIILHEQPNSGRTIVEKFEKDTLNVEYAFILLTRDDLCDGQNFRARQNVILELGYLWGKLGRHNVCCLYKGEVELPSDIHGIIYIKFKETIEEVYHKIETELKKAGIRFKLESPAYQ